MSNYFKQGEKTNKILKVKPKWHTGTGCWYYFKDENKDDFIANKIHHYEGDDDGGTVEVPIWFYNLKFGKK